LGEVIENVCKRSEDDEGRDLLFVALKGQAYNPYSTTGIHLTFNKYISQRQHLQNILSCQISMIYKTPSENDLIETNINEYE